MLLANVEAAGDNRSTAAVRCLAERRPASTPKAMPAPVQPVTAVLCGTRPPAGVVRAGCMRACMVKLAVIFRPGACGES